MIAKCREKSLLEALLNGHGIIFPHSDVKFKNGWAYFYRDNKQVWSCNEDYARHNFDIVENDK